LSGNERTDREDAMRTHRISKTAMTEAENICREWAESGASNRYKVDRANILLTALALTAESMTVAGASLTERREAAISGAVEVFTADWDALVEGKTRPDQKIQRRLMSALALVGSRVRLDWVRVEDEFYIIRTG
jgi:hypothetical protein